jgi:hypothetical protein
MADLTFHPLSISAPPLLVSRTPGPFSCATLLDHPRLSSKLCPTILVKLPGLVSVAIRGSLITAHALSMVTTLYLARFPR